MLMMQEIILCIHEILSVKRNTAARLALKQSPFFLPFGDVSSNSATKMSINNWSCDEALAVSKSDDVAVDSLVTGKRRPRVTFCTGGSGHKQGTDDGSISHHKNLARKPSGKAPHLGKTIPERPMPAVASCNLFDDGEQRLQNKKVYRLRLHGCLFFYCTSSLVLSHLSCEIVWDFDHVWSYHKETLWMELVMTSDQADLKNKLLPKGYAYVPSDSILPKHKWAHCNPRPEDGE